MGNTMENLEIIMIRPHLDGFPVYPVPPGFSLRWYEPGDEERWLRIQKAADQWNDITPDLFRQEFGADQIELTMRQVYLCDREGEPVGTATAWYDDDFDGEPAGLVHWVAILPEYQGRGLAKCLMSIILERMVELGDERAVLWTSTARTAAIRLYLRFGFEPVIRDGREREAWRSIQEVVPEFET